jgi:hypothetical protein
MARGLEELKRLRSTLLVLIALRNLFYLTGQLQKDLALVVEE